jgi:hypothetical protein
MTNISFEGIIPEDAQPIFDLFRDNFEGIIEELHITGILPTKAIPTEIVLSNIENFPKFIMEIFGKKIAIEYDLDEEYGHIFELTDYEEEEQYRISYGYICSKSTIN